MSYLSDLYNTVGRPVCGIIQHSSKSKSRVSEHETFQTYVSDEGARFAALVLNERSQSVLPTLDLGRYSIIFVFHREHMFDIR